MNGLGLLMVAGAVGLWWVASRVGRWADRGIAEWRAQVAEHDTSMAALGRATTFPGGEVVDLTEWLEAKAAGP